MKPISGSSNLQIRSIQSANKACIHIGTHADIGAKWLTMEVAPNGNLVSGAYHTPAAEYTEAIELAQVGGVQ